ncbi:hypothetical protein ACJMK2_033425 [Sinanodonta woodiana]|uniref:Uncharacterized protein n=1 Tax=Sinanodonta woodiana TaxID=1069815 RepID=A0ABD3WNC0_SINWO
MTLFLSPSNINFTNCIDHVTMPDLTMNKKIMDITRKFIARGSYPKLQVVEKDGHYFTLNDTKLMIFRHLEKMGQCEYVQVEKVSRKDVPEGIRNMMTIPPDHESEYETKVCEMQNQCKHEFVYLVHISLLLRIRCIFDIVLKMLIRIRYVSYDQLYQISIINTEGILILLLEGQNGNV